MNNPRAPLWSTLASRYQDTPEASFIFRPDEACCQLYKSILPDTARFTLEFALTDEAICLILANEFRFTTNAQNIVELRFAKNQLDHQSWLLANGLRKLPIRQGDEYRLASLVDSLMKVFSHPSVKRSINLENFLVNKASLMAELTVLIALYCHNWISKPLEEFRLLDNNYGLWQLLQTALVHAMNKAAAAEVMFGADCVYTQLWQDKQTQLFQLTKALNTQRSQSMNEGQAQLFVS